MSGEYRPVANDTSRDGTATMRGPRVGAHGRRRRWSRRAGRWCAAALVVGFLAASAPVPRGEVTRQPTSVRAMLFERVGEATAIPRLAVKLGPAAPHTMVRVDLVLAPSGPAALRALATAVGTPESPDYRQYLSASQFAARFAPPSKVIQTVEATERAAGLTTRGVSADHLVVRFSGTAAAIERAFATQLVRYRLPDGSVAIGDTRAPRLATAVAEHVSAVAGLETVDAPMPSDLVRESTTASTGPETALVRMTVPPGVDRGRRADVSHTTAPQPSPSCAQQMQAAQTSTPGVGGAPGFTSATFDTSSAIAQAYGFDDLYAGGDLGQGSTVALIEFAPYLTGDITAFEGCFGLTSAVTAIPVDGGAGVAVTGGPGVQVGGQEEAELDVEDVIGLAPDASVLVYEAPSTESDAVTLDAFSAAVANPAVQVISTSWGTCEAGTDAALTKGENALFEEAAVTGKSIVAAAGDDGSEDCYGIIAGSQGSSLAVDDPASQPFVTGVGGTTFTSIGPPPSEIVWKTSSGAGGGGVSSLWAMPSYQSTAAPFLHVVRAHSKCATRAGNCREVPDVAADAGSPLGIYCSETGREGCSSAGWTGFGGTSVAAPIWAAFFALADESTACAGRPIGFANPALYAVAGSSVYGDAFTDVAGGDNDLLGVNGGDYPATAGYNLVTGLGTPIAGSGSGSDSGLVTQLCALAPELSSPGPAITGLRPSAGPVSGGGRLTIIGAKFVHVTAVFLGATKVTTFKVVSATKIVVVLPRGTGMSSVRVKSSTGTSPVSPVARYTYLARPLVDALSPSTGPASGGTVVTITGERFVDVSAVHFGPVPATNVTVLSPETVVATAPAGSGAADVTVTTPGGTSARRGAHAYSYAS